MFRKGSVLVRSDPSNTRETTGLSTNSASDHLEGSAETDESSRQVDGPVDGAVVCADGRSPRGKRAKKVKPYEGLTGEVEVLHVDIIKDDFWRERPWLLA
jgi:hypothetical protein